LYDSSFIFVFVNRYLPWLYVFSDTYLLLFYLSVSEIMSNLCPLPVRRQQNVIVENYQLISNKPISMKCKRNKAIHSF
jgi:hypothetical protein